MDLRNPEHAEAYLVNHDYEEVFLHEGEFRLSYRSWTGDATWEGGVAEEYAWVREENGGCCVETMKNGKKVRYCSNCGVGINGLISWIRIAEESHEKSLREEIYDTFNI